MSRVYFVHPKRESVFGVPCYKSISDIPDTIDMMVICTSQKTVIPLLKEGAAIKDFMAPARVVDGIESDHARKLMERLY